jgi:CBS domain-containing protein
MKNSEFCNREVVIASPGESISVIAGLMKKHHSGNVIIVEYKNEKTIPVGIVTDRDIVIKVVAEGIPFDTVKASDIMSKQIYSVEEEHSIQETFDLMRANGIRRVPVINSKGELQGILTVDDILEIIADETSALAKTIKKEQTQEIKQIG